MVLQEVPAEGAQGEDAECEGGLLAEPGAVGQHETPLTVR